MKLRRRESNPGYHGVNINQSIDNDGSFYTAIYKGHLECLRALLDHRVNINQCIDNEWIILYRYL